LNQEEEFNIIPATLAAFAEPNNLININLFSLSFGPGPEVVIMEYCLLVGWCIMVEMERVAGHIVGFE